MSAGLRAQDGLREPRRQAAAGAGLGPEVVRRRPVRQYSTGTLRRAVRHGRPGLVGHAERDAIPPKRAAARAVHDLAGLANAPVPGARSRQIVVDHLDLDHSLLPPTSIPEIAAGVEKPGPCVSPPPPSGCPHHESAHDAQTGRAARHGAAYGPDAACTPHACQDGPCPPRRQCTAHAGIEAWCGSKSVAPVAVAGCPGPQNRLPSLRPRQCPPGPAAVAGAARTAPPIATSPMWTHAAMPAEKPIQLSQ